MSRICLVCGKPIDENNSFHQDYHDRCYKSFFKDCNINDIFNETYLNAIEEENLKNKETVPGVQEKMSLNYRTSNYSKKINNQEYIVKFPSKRFPYITETEFLVMNMASIAKIQTVPHALVKVNNEYYYVTKRIDRLIQKNEVIKFPMEDFCQLSSKLTEEKYHGSYEQCAKLIKQYSSRSKIDLTSFFIGIVFNYIIGNSDMHLKNFSLIANDGDKKEYFLSPSYDLVPVNLIYKKDTEEFALTLNGKKKNVHKKDFLILAKACGIDENLAIKMMNRFNKYLSDFETMIDNPLLNNDLKKEFKELIKNRLDNISAK